MIVQITLGAAEDSVTAALPREMMERLKLRPGDKAFAIETERGVLLTAHDPTFDAAVRAFEAVRRDYRSTLRKLAE